MNNEELRKLVVNYRPSEATVSAMRAVSLIAAVGPSGSGKSTVLKALANSDPQFHFVVGETSRPRRVNEVDGIDLYFRSRDKIIADLIAGKLTQAVVGPNGDLYCTHANNFYPSGYNLFPLIPQGVQQFRSLGLKLFVVAFIVPATFELWQQWLELQAKNSGWTEEKLKGRLAEAKINYEFALNDGQIRFVLNDELEKSAKRLSQLAYGHELADEDKAKTVANENYIKLIEILN